MKRGRVEIEVQTAPTPIDLASWARDYVALVLKLEGVARSEIRELPRPTFAEAG